MKSHVFMGGAKSLSVKWREDLAYKSPTTGHNPPRLARIPHTWTLGELGDGNVVELVGIIQSLHLELGFS